MMSFCRNALPATKWFAFFLLAIAGAIGSISSIYTIWTGHPLRADLTPPNINSSFESKPYCEFSVIIPHIEVEEPDTGTWEWKTGIKLVQMYAGADKIGEWPIFTKDRKVFDLNGEKFQRNSSAPSGPIITVAEDYAGNVKVKKIDGEYHPPFCYNAELAKENKCICSSITYGNTVAKGIEEKEAYMKENNDKGANEKIDQDVDCGSS